MLWRGRIRPALLPALSGLLLVGFVSALGLGAVAGPRRTSSALDGGALPSWQRPSVQGVRDGSFMSSTETWLDDHLPGRQHWLELHAAIARSALRQQVIHDVFVGDPQGMLFDNVKPLKVPTRLGTDAGILGQTMRAAGVPLLPVYIPRREEAFADRLPPSWPRTLLATKPPVLQALSQAGPVLDLSPILSDPARRDAYYWRTDQHWTPAGALAGLQAITERAATLGVDIPAEPRPMTEHTYPPFYGSLGREVTAGGTPRADDFAVPLPATLRARLCTSTGCTHPTFVSSLANDSAKYANRYRAFGGGDFGYQRFRNTSPEAHGTILLIKDSFGDALSTYLAERVSTLVTIDERQYSGADIAAVVQRIHPELVILMHNQVSMIGNVRFDPGIWVDVADAVKRRDARAATANDG
jgi:hypothetical protein